MKWARSLICFVKDPPANDGSLVEPFRVNLAFRWIVEFQDDVARWQRLLDVVETSLHFVRWEGYFRGAEAILPTRLTPLQGSPSADRLIEQVIQFVKEQSQVAQPGERLLGSSECIESLIGQGKRLEGQQSRSGFTAMILGIAAAVVLPTRQAIEAALETVKTKDLKAWAHHTLGPSVQACRRVALKDPLREQKRDKIQ